VKADRLDGIFIGVVHRDPDGARRLLSALQTLRPALLTLEVSPYAVSFRRQHSTRLMELLEQNAPAGKKDHGEIQAIRETLEIPFEVRAAQLFSEANPIHVELIDDSDLSRELLRDISDELLTPENLAALADRPDVPLPRMVSSFYRRTRRLMAQEPVPPALLGFSPERLALLELRDESMERHIRKLLSEHPNVRWIHVGGVVHLLRVRGLNLLWSRFEADGLRRAYLDELVN